MEEQEIVNPEDVARLVDAECIYISSWVEFDVDLSQFRNLVYARVNSTTARNLDSCTSLQELRIYPYKRAKADLSKLVNLQRLFITQSDIVDLEFIRSMPRLSHLELAYCPKLTDISGLLHVSDTLEILTLSKCRRVENIEILSACRNLKKLLLDGYEMDDIEWVRDLRNLKHLAVMGSNVLDGNIEPATHVEYVAIDNRKHYNYKFDRNVRNIVKK